MRDEDFRKKWGAVYDNVDIWRDSALFSVTLILIARMLISFSVCGVFPFVFENFFVM